jgi:hypothetical protein
MTTAKRIFFVVHNDATEIKTQILFSFTWGIVLLMKIFRLLKKLSYFISLDDIVSVFYRFLYKMNKELFFLWQHWGLNSEPHSG